MDNFNPQAIFIVITVFILFLNKVVEMMRAKSAERSAKQDRDERRAQSPPRPSQHQPQRPVQQQHPQTQPQRQQQPPPVPASPYQDVLTELFEAAGVPQKQAQQRPAVTPPPIPEARSKVSEPKLSKQERAALERLERRSERSIANRQRRRREASDKIARLLLAKDAARQAIIVAEILGPPRGIRDIEYR